MYVYVSRIMLYISNHSRQTHASLGNMQNSLRASKHKTSTLYRKVNIQHKQSLSSLNIRAINTSQQIKSYTHNAVDWTRLKKSMYRAPVLDMDVSMSSMWPVYKADLSSKVYLLLLLIGEYLTFWLQTKKYILSPQIVFCVSVKECVFSSQLNALFLQTIPITNAFVSRSEGHIDHTVLCFCMWLYWLCLCDSSNQVSK